MDKNDFVEIPTIRTIGWGEFDSDSTTIFRKCDFISASESNLTKKCLNFAGREYDGIVGTCTKVIYKTVGDNVECFNTYLSPKKVLELILSKHELDDAIINDWD